MKVSTKSTLLSVLTLASLLSSSIAMAGLTPGQIEAENRNRQQQNQQGLTPGQIQAENNQNDLEADRERERIARLRQAEREAARLAAIREAARLARLAAEREEAERIFRQQEAIRIQQQIEAQRLADEAARLAAEARKGSASIVFTGVTRKAGGEWLRVMLAQPMQLSSIEISVLEAKAKTHQIIVHTDNQQSFDLQTDGRIIFSTSSGAQIKELANDGIANRITAIDMRVESMGAKSVINVKVNSTEGVPTLSKQKFAAQ